jgi:hypothetical protein
VVAARSRLRPGRRRTAVLAPLSLRDAPSRRQGKATAVAEEERQGVLRVRVCAGPQAERRELARPRDGGKGARRARRRDRRPERRARAGQGLAAVLARPSGDGRRQVERRQRRRGRRDTEAARRGVVGRHVERHVEPDPAAALGRCGRGGSTRSLSRT